MAASKGWKIWVDRGGTFTDVVARNPNDELCFHKLLSENPEQYCDAAIEGIRNVLKVKPGETIPVDKIDSIKMGTTVATNALLEHRGEPTALVITKGFADALKIAYQNRPSIFAREIILPKQLYTQVVEIEERMTADGEILIALSKEKTKKSLQAVYDSGIRSLAVVLMHAYSFHDHELMVGEVAKEIGFSQISISHQVSPLIKLVGRGDTTVIDAYLTPIIQRYVESISKELPNTKIFFMQSNGGLVDANYFCGKDSIVSGPAGGVVGSVKTSLQAGFDKVIGFDMGGTSTDISHYQGEYERILETQIAGVRLRVPMLHIHTIAAGGGSILHFSEGRYQVGPDSAGANPGPVSYRRGGALTLTDCNVLLGRIQAAYFPNVFGEKANESLDKDAVIKAFRELQEKINTEVNKKVSLEEIAFGFLNVAVSNMVRAIKKQTVERGYDVSEYALCSFGGAAGQHACMVAERLGIKKIILHPLASVLSAYGLGLADLRLLHQKTIEKKLDTNALKEIIPIIEVLKQNAKNDLEKQLKQKVTIDINVSLNLRYDGSDTALIIRYEPNKNFYDAFVIEHQRQYGFHIPERALIISAIIVEALADIGDAIPLKADFVQDDVELTPATQINMYVHGGYQSVPLYLRQHLRPKDRLNGPCMIADETTMHIVETGWDAIMNEQGVLCLQHIQSPQNEIINTECDPIRLEIFNNLFMSIAEQMGVVLANTAMSVNIKERLDFSCAVFDTTGSLVANAPHMPVHLGSMGESVRAIIHVFQNELKQGDVYLLNDPYAGGTHLPDVTVITPVFGENNELLFFVASRGHHADIGGITPSSMPAMSQSIEEEGILIKAFKIIEQDVFQEATVKKILSSGKFPVRNLEQNIGDLTAQIAANKKGEYELLKMSEHFGLNVVKAYMQHVQDNAEASVRSVLKKLKAGAFSYEMDNGAIIHVMISIDHKNNEATIDFSKTSVQTKTNFNAPRAVCRAAVLYVLRTLVDANIPLNDGCLKPINLIIPEGNLLNPHYPAAVVAGNVETSQCIVDCLYGALGVMAGSQGTMNNFTFGNDEFQYYETIAGGSGAGDGFSGADAVQTHMTNSRLTDPEVLECRFPVLLKEFRIRKNSGGQGKWHGGCGTVREIVFNIPMTVSILSEHRKIKPFGLRGGQCGQPGKNTHIKKSGEKIQLKATAQVDVLEGDSILIETPGGGGYGETEKK